jgi:hypothetical protein
MQVQHNDSGDPIPTRSLFRKMREVAIRPRNYAAFHTTMSDSDSYQGGKKERNEWTTSWKNGSKMPVTAEENESERKLREENEALKIRLNAANNAIRDLENVCKKHRHQVQGTTTQRFCSFLPKSYRDRQGGTYSCDNRSHYSTAVASQASTVQMGSGAVQKLRGPGRSKDQNNITASDQDGAKVVKSFKHSCSNSLIFGPKLRKKLALREIVTSTENVSDVTPPCTPERSKRNHTKTKSAKDKAIGSLRSGTWGNVGIDHFDRISLPKEERRRKLLSFKRLTSNTQALSRLEYDDANQYVYDGAYPIDIYPANPIHDDTDDSDVEQLPVVHEMYATQFNIGEKYEI